MLSGAGREVLIKAAVQGILNYIMSYYKIPDGCCEQIEKIISKFWWGVKEGERKIHCLRLERLSKAKCKKGICFREVDFHKALLGKQCWRLIHGEPHLLGRMFKVRYYPTSDFMEAKVGYSPSYA